MKKTVLCLLMVFAVISAGQAENQRIAVVDMGRIIEAHPMTAANRSVTREEIAEFEAEQEKMLAALDEMRSAVEKAAKDAGNSALSDAARKASMKKARGKSIEMQKYEMGARQKVMRREKEIADQKLRMRRRVVAKIATVVADYAKKEKLELVLDSSGIGANGSESVVFSEERIDITTYILKVIKKAE